MTTQFSNVQYRKRKNKNITIPQIKYNDSGESARISRNGSIYKSNHQDPRPSAYNRDYPTLAPFQRT
jgi:hypothetical protein